MRARTALLAAGLLLGFAVLLVLAEALPDGPVVRRLVAEVDAGRYGPPLVPDRFGGFHDGFTECVVLGQGLGTPPTPMGLLERAMWAPRIGSCVDGADQIRALAGGTTVEAGPYFRYWNGYVVVTRPVLAAAGLTGVRVVSGALLAAAAIAAGVTIARRLGWTTVAALALPVLVTTNVATTPAGSFTHALSLAAALAGTAVVAAAADRGVRAAAGMAAIAAAGFVYVDLLTTPAVPWLLAVFVAGAVTLRRGATTHEVVTMVAVVGTTWPTAWAATWASRWVLAAALHGTEVFRTIGEVGRFRLSGDLQGVDATLGAATRANLTWWLTRPASTPIVAGLAVAVAIVGLVVIARRHGWPGVGTTAVLALPVLVVPAWYELFSNHSQVHAYFAHRSIPVALGVGLAACLLVARVGPGIRQPHHGDDAGPSGVRA